MGRLLLVPGRCVALVRVGVPVGRPRRGRGGRLRRGGRGGTVGVRRLLDLGLAIGGCGRKVVEGGRRGRLAVGVGRRGLAVGSVRLGGGRVACAWAAVRARTQPGVVGWVGVEHKRKEGGQGQAVGGVRLGGGRQPAPKLVTLSCIRDGSRGCPSSLTAVDAFGEPASCPGVSSVTLSQLSLFHSLRRPFVTSSFLMAHFQVIGLSNPRI